MASIADRRSIGQEVVLAVRSTGTGIKVVQLDGTGLAEGVMSKRNRRYIYDENAEEKATDYAYRTAENIRDARDVQVTVVELGEVIHEKLAEVGEP